MPEFLSRIWNPCRGGCSTVSVPPFESLNTTPFADAPLSSDGAFPFAGLIADRAGNLYGTTVQGGSNLGRTAYEGHQRSTPWNNLQYLYFIGYAFWNTSRPPSFSRLRE